MSTLSEATRAQVDRVLLPGGVSMMIKSNNARSGSIRGLSEPTIDAVIPASTCSKFSVAGMTERPYRVCVITSWGLNSIEVKRLVIDLWRLYGFIPTLTVAFE